MKNIKTINIVIIILAVIGLSFLGFQIDKYYIQSYILENCDHEEQLSKPEVLKGLAKLQGEINTLKFILEFDDFGDHHAWSNRLDRLDGEEYYNGVLWSNYIYYWGCLDRTAPEKYCEYYN